MLKEYFIISVAEKTDIKRETETTKIWLVTLAGLKIYNYNYRPWRFHGGCYHNNKSSLDSEERVLTLLSKWAYSQNSWRLLFHILKTAVFIEAKIAKLQCL
jgi:hypothetical protein